MLSIDHSLCIVHIDLLKVLDYGEFALKLTKCTTLNLYLYTYVFLRFYKL